MAFVEILSGVVRFGPRCDKDGDPYRGAVAFSSDRGLCIIKALTKPEGGLTQTDAKDIIRALKAVGIKATWERVTYGIDTEASDTFWNGLRHSVSYYYRSTRSFMSRQLHRLQGTRRSG